MILERRAPQVEAFKFEGGYESAVQVITWLRERNVHASYSPEIGLDGRIVQYEHVLADREPTRIGGRFAIGKGEWVVDDPESTIYPSNEDALFEQYKELADGDAG